MYVNSATNWNEIPATTRETWAAPRAEIIFTAETSLRDRVKRVFNNTVFTLAAVYTFASLTALIPGLTGATGHMYTLLGASALLPPIVTVAMPIVVTLAVALTIRKILACIIISAAVYPATWMSREEGNDSRRQQIFDLVESEGLGKLHRITQNKPDMGYDSFALEHNREAPWVICAGGNGMIGEKDFYNAALEFRKLGFNILYVNGPGVSCSRGFATSYTMGAGVEAGLQFLETVIKTKQILIYGISLGGGMQAKSICSHTFKDDIQYMAWTHVTFSKLSNAASAMTTSLVKPVFFLLGIELDGIAGAKRLQELNIRHIVTQNTHEGKYATDGVIPNSASLVRGLNEAGINDGPRLQVFGNQHVTHNDELPLAVSIQVAKEIQDFFKS